DHHVDGSVGEGDVLDVSLDELHVRGPCVGRVAAAQFEPPVGHVEAVCESGRAHPLRGEEDVDAAARAEVENRFALTQIGDSGRVSAPQAGFDCAGGEVAEIGD